MSRCAVMCSVMGAVTRPRSITVPFWGNVKWTYNPRMARFVIEHLPRIAATYDVVPVDAAEAKEWLQVSGWTSIIRTTEVIGAVKAGMGIDLVQSDFPMTLVPGDEALLMTLSFGVLFAWVEGKIAPLADDWRLLLLTVKAPPATLPIPVLEVALAEDFSSSELN